MSFLFPVLLLTTSLFSTAILSFLPYMARRTECFSISIPEKEYGSPKLKGLRKRFSEINIILGLLILGVSAWAYSFLGSLRPIVALTILVQYFIVFLIFQYFRGKVKKFKENSEWKNDVETTVTVDLSNEKKGYPSSVWLAVYPVMIAITVLLGFLLYSRLPARVPIHYNESGTANGFVQKSYMVIFINPLLQAFLASVFSVSFLITKSRRRRIDPSNEEESLRRQNIFRNSFGRFFLFGGMLLLLMVTIMQLAMFGVFNSSAIMISSTAVVIIMLVYSAVLRVRVGQGGSRIKTKKPSEGRLNIKDSDDNWKFGAFYWNPNDPTIFVERRWGIGFTMNFARPASYIVIAALILGIIGITVLIKFVH